ncbi:imidazole glycerol phosphate synthase subunit hisH protein family [Synechococcus sp. WH 8103]|nr:imidazole glycerol phosphate synthase subunit hisH protein family [Synechococcus sp. WH 8103]
MSKNSKVGIVDYGAGNLKSVCNAIEYVGSSPVIVSSDHDIKKCNKLILPGVGAFSRAMQQLDSKYLTHEIIESVRNGLPILGICLGMQMLFDKSFEFGETDGLGLISGNIAKLGYDNKIDENFRLPHVAWTNLMFKSSCPSWLFKSIPLESRFYFIHSYAAQDHAATTTVSVSEYEGISFTSTCIEDNIIGTQYHPEKSGPMGLKLLENYLAHSF